ncbi:pentatricopeptide repeat-containing protein [Carex littledalei]|uniref:Pentatricopeptide repeat-containing protein n=1 Tax=Carex littledalei TaxID=544730 RepID=A0A833RF14_9POAL|nr:pentatricopeptide repeat-containing protein [Carex littledalei]
MSAAAGAGVSTLRRLLQTLPLLLPQLKTQLSASSIPPVFVLNRAIEALASHDFISYAQQLFDQMPERNGGSWNALISAYSRSNQPNNALSVFSFMCKEGVRPKDVTLASVLGCCSDVLDLSLARQIHALVLKLGFSSNVIINTSLVDIYGKCDVMCDAERVFDYIPNPNVVSWNVLIRRYYELGRGGDAIEALFQMIRAGVLPLNFTISNSLLACADASALLEGRQIHGFVVKIGYYSDINSLVRNCILEMYAKCGALDEASELFDKSERRDTFMWTSMLSGYVACGRIQEAAKLFDRMPERNIVSWNAMIGGYINCSASAKALDFFRSMKGEEGAFDNYTLGAVLKACAELLDLEKGRQVHGFAYRHGYHLDHYLCNVLIGMYAKCGHLRNMEALFFRILKKRDRVSWNSVILGYERHCRGEEALYALREMLREASPNESTLTIGLSACANIFALDHGKQIHAYILRNGYRIDDIIRDALVSMYSKCRFMDYSIRVFEERESRDVVIWNSVILGCVYNGKGQYALELFEEMRKREIKADNVTFIGTLLACICEGFVDLGQRYFNSMSEDYSIMHRMEHYECMIELFSKHGCMVELEEFVKKMPLEPTVPMWLRIYDACREFGNPSLGKTAEKYINESNPLNPS